MYDEISPSFIVSMRGWWETPLKIMVFGTSFVFVGFFESYAWPSDPPLDSI